MARIIDLTLTLRNGMRGVDIKPAHSPERDGWNASTLGLYSHCGTHMDATIHFGVGEEAIEAIALEKCIGPAWVVDVSSIQPRELIEVRHLGKVAE